MSITEFSSTVFPDDLKPKWRERFEFFEKYSRSSSPEARAALKASPSGKKRLINLSWLGFFFGPFYFFSLGMWKRGFTLFTIQIVFATAEYLFEFWTGINIPLGLDFGFNTAFAIMSAMTVNYSYYLYRMHGDNGWNPFK